MFNVPLLLCLIISVAVAGLAQSMVRGAAEELPADTRDRIRQAEQKSSKLWRTFEWLGIALIMTGMFLPQLVLFTAANQRFIAIACGLWLFCFSNTGSAWFSMKLYQREAPNTPAAKASFKGAIFVTIAEVVLLAVVAIVVLTKLTGFSLFSTNTPTTSSPAEKKPYDTVWIDEATAFKQLGQPDPDYIQGLSDSGALHTKDIGGKKMYSLRDIEILAAKKKDAIP